MGEFEFKQQWDSFSCALVFCSCLRPLFLSSVCYLLCSPVYCLPCCFFGSSLSCLCPVKLDPFGLYSMFRGSAVVACRLSLLDSNSCGYWICFNKTHQAPALASRRVWPHVTALFKKWDLHNFFRRLAEASYIETNKYTSKWLKFSYICSAIREINVNYLQNPYFRYIYMLEWLFRPSCF